VSEEPLVVPGTIAIPFSYAAGAAASRFLAELRDARRIMATRCPGCRRVLVPARSFCGACWVDVDDWVEVGPEGVLVTWSTLHVPLPHLAGPVPYTLGLVRLDGADTDFLHRVAGDGSGLARGTRVRPVWGETRSGGLLDLAHFVPVTPGGPDGLRDDRDRRG